MKIQYKINQKNHNIYFKKNIEKSLISEIEKVKSDKKILFIYDNKIHKDIVDKLFQNLKNSGCQVSAYEFKGNKHNKNEKTLFSLINLMMHKKFTKKSILISLGGGVIGDVSALAASLYYRGIIYFYIPSTMTSIVDSCIGGKTGINYNNVINSVGNYYHANSVFIYYDILRKLPDREYFSGLPEIVKCGLIKRNRIINILLNSKNKILDRDYKILETLCSETLKTKIFFFKNDIYENGSRLYLNFGHTFAHSFEMATEKLLNKELLRHGEAVGIGMLCEILLSTKKKNSTFFLLEKILKLYSLPTRLNEFKLKISKQKLIDQIYNSIFLDKKKINKYPRYISLKTMHKPKIKEIQNTGDIIEIIKAFI
jgi:3-dehydroquinate synthase